MEEIQGVLARKLGWTRAMRDEAAARLARFTVRVVPSQTLQVIKSDPDDDRVLECAVAAGSRFIVSEDRHMLSLGNYQQIQIVKLSEFLQLLPL